MILLQMGDGECKAHIVSNQASKYHFYSYTYTQSIFQDSSSREFRGMSVQNLLYILES